MLEMQSIISRREENREIRGIPEFRMFREIFSDISASRHHINKSSVSVLEFNIHV